MSFPLVFWFIFSIAIPRLSTEYVGWFPGALSRSLRVIVNIAPQTLSMSTLKP